MKIETLVTQDLTIKLALVSPRERCLATSADIELLTNLGLTFNEARVFFALSRNGISTAKALTISSGVAREVVYQVMPKLQEKGLIEKIMTSPVAFNAIPIDEAYSILLQRKEEEYTKLGKKSKNAPTIIKARLPHQKKTCSQCFPREKKTLVGTIAGVLPRKA